MDYLQIANSMPMWIAAGGAVALIIIMAVIFALKSYRTGKEIGITDAQMKGAIKSASITSIGPSIVILSTMLTLLITVGGPVAWMRLSFIGAVMFESMAAGFGTQAVGVELGSAAMNGEALAAAVWTMVLGSIGWIIWGTFVGNKMDKVQNIVAKGDTKILGVISGSAVLGTFAAMGGSHLVKMNLNSIACLVGAVAMYVFLMLAKKTGKNWLNEWALTFAILIGMLSTLVF
ncbi:DUF5058 family protein [Anaerotignum sp.]